MLCTLTATFFFATVLIERLKSSAPRKMDRKRTILMLLMQSASDRKQYLFIIDIRFLVDELRRRARPVFGIRGETPLVQSGTNVLTAFKCCVENNRRAEFLDWRVCRAAVCPKMGRTRCRPTGQLHEFLPTRLQQTHNYLTCRFGAHWRPF